MMRPTEGMIHIGKFIGLTILFFFCFILPTFLIPVSPVLAAAAAEREANTTLMMLLLFSLMSAVAISYPIRHSVVGGFRLAASVIVTVFGFMTFMGQIETYYFRSAFPALSTADVLDIVYRGFLTALFFVPPAIIVWNKMKRGSNIRVTIPWASWLWRAPLLALAYICLYYGFGYYVAWQVPETRMFYTGSAELVGVVEHTRRVVTDTPLFFPMQFVRGLLWIVFALPLILILGGNRTRATVSLGLLGALFGLQILLPNPLFPDAVRYAHTLETVPSTALYGALIGFCITARGHQET